MVHLIHALTEAGVSASQAALHNPIVTVIFDCKNAFNTAYRKALAAFLRKGCEFHTSLPPGVANGWNVLSGHIRAHYGVHGLLKFLAKGHTYHISSQSGVQQGDPLGSTLFALTLHPILLDVGQQVVDIIIAAFADNFNFTGPLDRVCAAFEILSQALDAAGLTLNPADSEVYIPSWRSLSLEELDACHASPAFPTPKTTLSSSMPIPPSPSACRASRSSGVQWVPPSIAPRKSRAFAKKLLLTSINYKISHFFTIESSWPSTAVIPASPIFCVRSPPQSSNL